MATKRKKVRNLITIKEYMKNKSIITNTPCICTNGEWFYLYENKSIQSLEFKKMFPTEGFVVTDRDFRKYNKGQSVVAKHIN